MSAVIVYLLGLTVVGGGIYRACAGGFSFHLLFSGLYGITFFAGLPLSYLMTHAGDHHLPQSGLQATVFGIAALGYLLYWLAYRAVSGRTVTRATKQAVDFADFSAKTTACVLAVIGLGSLLAFIGLNDGLLLFRLEKYSQIFSASVQGVALKRFFYFFLVALVLGFLLKPSRQRWGLLLLLGILFGGLNYAAVGGTRANLALAVVFFVLLGSYQGYLSRRAWWGFAIVGTVAMFGLALLRYGLNVQGREAWFTFLYLTRDSFSPWENLARIFSAEIEFQGVSPFWREFYVYIPKSLWAARPDIVWNSANYFTKIVLGNQSGLAISPTLLGSLYIMGGYPLIAVGMAVVGMIMAWFDRLFRYGQSHSVIVQAFCFGQLFNVMVLVREGAEAFFSRVVFFSLVFGLAYLIGNGVARVWKR